MRHIFAIGGGEIRLHDTFTIDKMIVEAANKKHPNLLFIPTASGEPEGYIEVIENIYGQELGCNVETLYLIKEDADYQQIRKKIIQSDIVYVGGGDTYSMLKLWKEHKVDKLLIEAYNNGTILSGLSAGSICWFEYGHSDSDIISNRSTRFIKINGLGLIKALHCPHYNEQERIEDFEKLLSESDDIGIAIENNCAIEIFEDKYRIIKSVEDAHAYKIYKKENKIHKEELVNTDYCNLDLLLSK
ncbi:peptidase E [Vallitalea longa]|uniref:Peptidase E n=1 Tax=Vallitalea longa TaxID=2936439 RepID=A0A9W5YD95_9FIRM|nr:peptidase E [Vallitalea longa]GKX31960.1 peptidase E [Vallitalea longa]